MSPGGQELLQPRRDPFVIAEQAQLLKEQLQVEGARRGTGSGDQLLLLRRQALAVHAEVRP